MQFSRQYRRDHFQIDARLLVADLGNDLGPVLHEVVVQGENELLAELVTAPPGGHWGCRIVPVAMVEWKASVAAFSVPRCKTKYFRVVHRFQIDGRIIEVGTRANDARPFGARGESAVEHCPVTVAGPAVHIE